MCGMDLKQKKQDRMALPSCLEIKPDYFLVLKSLSEIYYAENDYLTAITYLKKALEVNP